MKVTIELEESQARFLVNFLDVMVGALRMGLIDTDDSKEEKIRELKYISIQIERSLDTEKLK